MRALLFHCKKYGVEISELATRPKDITPEEVKEKRQNCKDCIVAFVTVEKHDDIKKTSSGLVKEIIKMCKEVGRDNVMIVPFAHLSNNLADTDDGLKAISLIENDLKDYVAVARTHFGSHKSLLLDVYGHPGNVRYREF